MPETETEAPLEQLREQVRDQQARITELEIEAAFRRKTLDDLDEVIRAQADRIDRLERQLAELAADGVGVDMARPEGL